VVQFVEGDDSAAAILLDEVQPPELQSASVALVLRSFGECEAARCCSKAEKLVEPTVPPLLGNALRHPELLEVPQEFEVAVLGVRHSQQG
jgi:hypothetical protein